MIAAGASGLGGTGTAVGGARLSQDSRFSEMAEREGFEPSMGD